MSYYIIKVYGNSFSLLCGCQSPFSNSYPAGKTSIDQHSWSYQLDQHMLCFGAGMLVTSMGCWYAGMLVWPAWDAGVLVWPAWDAGMLVWPAWDAGVLVWPAWDAGVLVWPAWDAGVLVCLLYALIKCIPCWSHHHQHWMPVTHIGNYASKQ